MAGVLQHLRSSTLNKRPNPASMVDGQVAINYASGSPGMFFKNSNGDLVKVGPVHVGSTAPNVSPASGGTAGNSIGEQWLDTAGGTYVFKIWDGAAWRSEAGEFVNTTGDTMTGSLTMGTSADIIFEGSVDDGFETTLTVANPTADRTITLPNVTGTVVTTGDSGTVTSTMIADGTIVNADVNASAAIAGTKISPDFGSQTVQTTGIFGHALGSAAAPTVTFTGDTNTGIYSPGADQVAISTSGTGRLFVDASGRVGVGTASPGFTLDVVGDAKVSATGNTVFQIAKTTTGGETRLTFDNATDSKRGQVRFNWAAQTHGAFEIWTPSNAANGQAIALQAGTDGTIFYGTTTSGTERARIDSSGRLLVGTSSAILAPDPEGVQRLGSFQIAANTFAGSQSLTAFYGTSAVSAGSFNFARSQSTTAGTHQVVVSNGPLGFLNWSGSDGTNFIRAASISAAVDGTPGANDMPGRIVLSTTASGASSPTERMRLGSDGKFTHFTDSDFQVSNSGTSAISNAFVVRNGATTTGTGTAVCQIREDGDIENTNNSYGAISDAKLKENIIDASSQWDDIKSLQVRKYNFKPETGYGTHTQIGLVAQEVELTSPGLVETVPDRDEDGNDLGTVTKSVNYSVLYMKAVKALQEAMERIETLEQRLNDAGIS